MSNAFIGEIRAFPYSFAPVGWLECNGQAVAIAEYQALAAVIRTRFGGDGSTTFGIPNLQGRVPRGAFLDQAPGGLGPVGLAVVEGTNFVTLGQNQMPPHSHEVKAEALSYKSAPGTFAANPTSGTSWPALYENISNPASPLGYDAYNPAIPPAGEVVSPTRPVTMAAGALAGTGQGRAHENRQPYLAFVFAINYDGAFPVNPN